MNRVFKSSISNLTNKKTKVISDNKNVSRILQIGSKKSYLQNIADEIFKTCSDNNIRVNPVWKPRAESKKADTLSRLTDIWIIGQSMMKFLNIMKNCGAFIQLIGLQHIITKKCVRFNSKHWCPVLECINAFNASCTEENNWLVPPQNLIAKVISKFVSDRAKVTLVIPEWKSSPFWPMQVA